MKELMMSMTMTQEEKQLLLKDLCARLPYDVCVHIRYKKGGPSYGKLTPKDIHWFIVSNIKVIKPYLRPMSSMTEEEKKEFESFGWMVDELDDNYPWVHIGQIENVLLGLNWLNAHHFDYRGLIEKDLALEAPEGLYT